ncbi:hypothetical protein MKW94_002257 [Papaver nudicaule]|uniref:Early light-induced protein n=1 Tax=Papaver nudicaule TaxID=74823 RepID=A0AA41VG94_PAPNU|nr:hypothetical protein [Papaver nudicaule]
MATASVNHSILTNRVTLVQTQTRKNASFRVRCMAEEEKPQQPMTTSNSTNPPPAAPQTPIATPTFPPPRAAPEKMSTKLNDLLAFSGPAPERINGRLAMIGFVAAMGVELARGTDVAAQLADGGLPWFVITSVVLSVASLIPLSQGVSVESKSKGLMSSSAEMLNGRVAMLGLVALVLTEAAKGGALI